MNLKRYSFLLLIVSACLATENTNAAAEKKIIPMRSEIDGHLPLEGWDFVLSLRRQQGVPGQPMGFTDPLFTKGIRTSCEGEKLRYDIQDIPVIGRDEETGVMYIRIPQGYQLSDKAKAALYKHTGRELEQREVSPLDRWRCDADEQWVEE